MKRYLWDLIVNGFCYSSIIGFRFRRSIFKILGMNLGHNTAIHKSCYISGNKLSLGDDSYINRNCTLDCINASIIIGKNVGVGFNCCFFTTNHDYSSSFKRTGKVIAKNIVIGDGCWIGGNSTICPGVSIAEGSVIGAGSVVTHDCQLKNHLYAGNPARKVRKL